MFNQFSRHSHAPSVSVAAHSPRVKDFDTGFLPTFVDVGYNFGGAIIAEDFMVHQLWEAKNVTTCLASGVAQEQGVDGAVPRGS
ncbi:hypothetical protein BC826DRAFT_1060608 [Russula brevipes]|nr:hypothetical protein BC826DRAFT_1060608 [Russula brevipes]